MPFEPGHPKLGGRAKGTPNKTNSRISDLCKERGVDPAEVLIELLHDSDNEMRLKAARTLMEYIDPKRRAEDSNGNPDDSLRLAPKTPEERLALVRAIRGEK